MADTILVKREVMNCKKNLKRVKKFSDVYIENDKSFEQRLFEANNRKLLHLIGDKEHQVRGGKIIRKQSNAEDQDQLSSSQRDGNNRHRQNGWSTVERRKQPSNRGNTGERNQGYSRRK